MIPMVYLKIGEMRFEDFLEYLIARRYSSMRESQVKLVYWTDSENCLEWEIEEDQEMV